MNAPYPRLSSFSLLDKYTQADGRIFLNGSQALVRLMLLQAQTDRLAGLNTGGFVSGYRGSPLGGVDQAFWAAQSVLEPAGIQFQPGLNEDLAATAVWGSQQVNLYPQAKVQGVFGLWYGKGPGVDRSLDVFKHANAAGTSPFGGVLLAAGDDHGAKSSTLPHQSDHVLKAAMMPILFPSNVQEILDYGLLGFALSRYCGAWVGFKLIADVVESSASVEVGPHRMAPQLPTDYDMPAGGLNIRWPDTALDQEARLLDHKLYAALAFARVNSLNTLELDSPHPRLGLVASGKAYLDTRQALDDLGLDSATCAQVGIRLLKVGMVWPLEPQIVRSFAKGLQEILVIEEKRQLLEYQIKEELYGWQESVRPKVYGKFDERLGEQGQEGGEWSIPQGRWLLPSHAELNAAHIAKAIAHRLGRLPLPPEVRHRMAQRIKAIRRSEEHARLQHAPIDRKPHFCSGCPHNSSTVVPQGSRALAGIGCHYMAVWMDRDTSTFTQMGGEGVPWIGQAAFTDTPHVFANLGDGTYFHSGILAIRASLAAKVNITYKILFNEAVAMTGGQPLDGQLTVPKLTRQLAAEGVTRTVLVTDTPHKYRLPNANDPFASGVEIHHRDNLERVQKELRSQAGVTVLIYAQPCATEKRRRNKRASFEAPPVAVKRVHIHPDVCEGCGDCSVQSNCLSVEPLPTFWGTKRTINQSTCNTDLSCLKGRCPSLMTVEGVPRKAALKQDLSPADWWSRLQRQMPQWPQPNLGPLHQTHRILIDGIGGTGVVTIGAWLGTAAHMQGLEITVLDMAGLAQKGGAVHSHVQFAPAGEPLRAAKIASAEVDVLLGGDWVVSASPQTLTLLNPNSCVLLNTDVPPTADFVRNREWTLPLPVLESDLSNVLANPHSQLVALPAAQLARHYLADTVYANAIVLGAAWQKGWVPLSLSALKQAIEVNGVQVDNNWAAFNVGRWAVIDPLSCVQGLRSNTEAVPLTTPMTDVRYLQHLVGALTDYQSAEWAASFEANALALHARLESHQELKPYWRRIVQCHAKLLCFKDEFEVARQLTRTDLQHSLLEAYQPGAKLQFHLAPSWWPRKASLPFAKITLGPGLQWTLKLLARLKWVRPTVLNPFAHTAEAKAQRELLKWFERWLELMQNEPPTEHKAARCQQIEAVLAQFESVKGFGQLRLQSFQQALPVLKNLISTR